MPTEFGIEWIHGSGQMSDRLIPTGKELETVLRKIFRRQQEAAIASIRSFKGIKLGSSKSSVPYDDQLYDLSREGWEDVIYVEARPVVERYYAAGIHTAAERIGIVPLDMAVPPPRIVESIDALTLQLSRSMNHTTQARLDEIIPRIREELREGLTAGDSYDRMARGIREVFHEATEARAYAIASTEAQRAVNAGSYEQARSSGVVIGHRWLLSGAACPMCVAIAADTEGRLIQFDQAFATVEGAPPAYSTIFFPPAHPHCACGIEEVLI